MYRENSLFKLKHFNHLINDAGWIGGNSIVFSNYNFLKMFNLYFVTLRQRHFMSFWESAFFDDNDFQTLAR